jgi:hypothetical protein
MFGSKAAQVEHLRWRHDTQHNDTQHIRLTGDTHHK